MDSKIMYTDAGLIELIDGGESERVEFTGSFSRDRRKKIREAVCAFANDFSNHRKPGFVFVGLQDDGCCAGLPVDDSLLLALGGLRNDGEIQPRPIISVEKRNIRGCDIVVVQVEPSENPPVRSGGRCWIRVGPNGSQAGAEEERRLTEKRRWEKLPYDAQGVRGASVEEDLDMARFESEYLPAAVSQEVLEQNDRELKEQLLALRLTTRDGPPTVMAVLMIGKDPSYWFPGAYIQFVRHDGNDLADPVKDQQRLRGTLTDQMRELDNILRANISASLDTSGKIHAESPDYPYIALREICRNALIHRNYDSSNTPVRIHWFGDRVEVISPGALYGRIRPGHFGLPDGTGYRNPTIAEAAKNMGFMEQFGMGMGMAQRALADNGNPPLMLKHHDQFICAVLGRRQ